MFRRTFLMIALLIGMNAPAQQAAVLPLRGAPTLVVDGKPNTGLSYMTYVGPASQKDGKPVLQHYADLFTKAECDLFTFVVDLGALYGYSPTVWPEKDRFDFSYVDLSAHTLLAGGPQAKLVIQLYLDTPEWWAKENPDDLLVLDNGKTDFGEKLFALPRKDNLPSIASERWRTDLKRLVEALIDHVQASDYADHVIGYQVCGQKTEEWYHWSMNAPSLGDYSAPMQHAFHAWLRQRYTSDAALQSAWHVPGLTRDTAPLPTQAQRFGDKTQFFRRPEAEQNVIDFHRFWSEVMVDTIAFFAHVVKEKTQHAKVVGGFYAYTFEFADLAEDAGHLALGKLLECPDLDFIMSPSSYFHRNLKGGQSCFRAPVLSLVRHGKMLWNDFDPASYKIHDKDMAALAPWLNDLAATDTPWEFGSMIYRELGNCLANGVNMAHFDLHGGYYDDAEIMGFVRSAQRIRKTALSMDRAPGAEILVVVDEDSLHWLGFRHPLTRRFLIEQLVELPFTGPYNALLLSDLADTDLRPYKLVLMLNAFRLDAAQRSVIDRKLKTDNKHVVWLYAPGYFRGDAVPGEVTGISEVTGLHIEERPRSATPVTAVYENPALGETPLLDTGRFAVADPEAEVIARSSEATKETVIAQRRFDRWTSIYAGTAPLPRQVLRALAGHAGVHQYDAQPEDTVYASGTFLTIAAGATGGPRTITLPKPMTVTDMATGQTVCAATAAFTAEFQPYETRLFAMNAADMKP